MILNKIDFEDKYPTIAFTKLFFKKYKKELVYFAEWAIKNSINIIVEMKEVSGFNYLNFSKQVDLKNSDIKAIICYTVDVLQRYKGYQFSSWDDLKQLDAIVNEPYLIGSIVSDRT